MATTLWILFDLLIVWRTSFLSREITRREKIALVIVGIGVAIYGGYSEHRDSLATASLAQAIVETQDEVKKSHAEQERQAYVLEQIAQRLTANPNPAEVKAAAAQLSAEAKVSLSRSAAIAGEGGTLKGEVVIRDRTGKVVARRTFK